MRFPRVEYFPCCHVISRGRGWLVCYRSLSQSRCLDRLVFLRLVCDRVTGCSVAATATLFPKWSLEFLRFAILISGSGYVVSIFSKCFFELRDS